VTVSQNDIVRQRANLVLHYLCERFEVHVGSFFQVLWNGRIRSSGRV
jgi:hypothetical protein